MSSLMQSRVWRLDVRAILNHDEGFTTTRSAAPMKLVMLFLADQSDDQGANIWPAVDTIAARTSVVRRTVQTMLGDLKRLGMLEEQSPSGGEHSSTTYRLTLDDVERQFGGGALSAPPRAASAPDLDLLTKPTEHPTDQIRSGALSAPPPALSAPPASDFQAVCHHYEKVISMLTPDVDDDIKAWLGKGFSVAEIVTAIDKAVARKARRIAYIRAIIEGSTPGGSLMPGGKGQVRNDRVDSRHEGRFT